MKARHATREDEDRRQRWFGLGLIVAVLGFATDQAHKITMLYGFSLRSGEGWSVTPFFDIVLHWNPGISYGLFAGAGPSLLIGVSALATGAFIVWLYRVDTRLMAISLGLIIGGAAGNMLDRIWHGRVADFFHFHVGSFSWYVFNLADVWIVAGLIGVVCDMIMQGRDSDTKGE